MYETLRVNFDNDPTGVLSRPSAKNWHNSSTFRLSGEYRFLNDSLPVRVGLVWDQSPAPDSTLGPELPDMSRWVVTAGIGYRYKPLGLKADLGWVFVPPQVRTVVASENAFPAKYNFTCHIVALTLGLGAM